MLPTIIGISERKPNLIRICLQMNRVDEKNWFPHCTFTLLSRCRAEYHDHCYNEDSYLVNEEIKLSFWNSGNGLKNEIMSLSIQVCNEIKVQFTLQCMVEVQLHSFLPLLLDRGKPSGSYWSHFNSGALSVGCDHIPYVFLQISCPWRESNHDFLVFELWNVINILSLARIKQRFLGLWTQVAVAVPAMLPQALQIYN
jgi:hypothetical protein